MIRHLVIATLFVSTMACAQSYGNRLERARDRQDLRQDRRQLKDDRRDAARTLGLLTDYDAAAAANDVNRLSALDAAFNQQLSQELAESQVESAQARQELREDRRELGSDRRELRQDVALNRRPGVTRDDVRDRRDDRRDLADDRRDAAKERLSRARLIEIQGQLSGLAGRFDPPSVSQKRALYGEFFGVAMNELHRDKQERREDRRELREDRKETREDRRDPIR